MKKLSIWAKGHKWQSRFIIVASFILLTGCGLIAGFLLDELSINLPFALLVVVISLFIFAGISYPAWKRVTTEKGRTRFYFRQKTCDLLLASCTFLMVVCIANNPGQSLRYSTPVFNPVMGSIAVTPKDSVKRTYISLAEFKKSMMDENGKPLKWKERKKLLKTQIRAIHRSAEISDGGKVALIILSILVAVALVIGIGALSCSISCGGSEGLAIIVFILGIAGVSLLLVYVIKRILGKKKKEIRNPETPPPGT
jgi:membrane protein implicated in regulation of membrane protease activity